MLAERTPAATLIGQNLIREIQLGWPVSTASLMMWRGRNSLIQKGVASGLPQVITGYRESFSPETLAVLEAALNAAWDAVRKRRGLRSAGNPNWSG
jgi:hypothetical protein